MVSFGLTQAPAYFQALILKMLEGLSHCAIAYLNHIIIFSKTEEGHLQHLEIIFERLHEEVKKVKVQLHENAHRVFGSSYLGKGHRTNARQIVSHQGDASTQKPQRNKTVLRFSRVLSKIHTEISDIQNH